MSELADMAIESLVLGATVPVLVSIVYAILPEIARLLGIILMLAGIYAGYQRYQENKSSGAIVGGMIFVSGIVMEFASVDTLALMVAAFIVIDAFILIPKAIIKSIKKSP